MTNITWPETLPYVRLSGLEAEKKSNVIRTSMDAGPQKARRRYTVSTKLFSGSIIISEKQRVILENFYDSILGGGVLRFVLRDPQTGIPAEFRFTEDYKEESREGLWEISMQLEKLNA